MPVFQILRNATAGTRPTGKLAGEPWVNYADKQFGVHDGTAANDMVAVRFFSALAPYAVGDHVVEAGVLYRCITAVTLPGPFTPASWEQSGSAPDLTPYLLLAGGTMVGPLVLAADPVADMEAATMGYVIDADALLLPLTAGPTVPLTGELHLPAAAPTLPAVATNKLYVDTADTALQDQITLLASNLLYSGSIDVVTDTGAYTAESGIPAGPLPVATAHANKYVIVNNGGTAAAGNIPAGTYALGDWIVSDGTAWLQMPIGQGSVTGGNVVITPPATQPTWTNIQLAIDGLEANKLDKAGGTMTGVLVLAADPVGLLEPVTLGYLTNAVLDAGVYVILGFAVLTSLLTSYYC